MPDVLLALETSGPVGSVAVARGGDVLARAFIEERSAQVARLVPAVERALRDAGLERRDLEGIVAGAGPGSFTGVRVAAATAKGLAHALVLPLWAFSSLAAAAVADLALPPGVGPFVREGGGPPARPDAEEPRWVLFDARGDRVYAGCYRPSPRGAEPLAAPRATTVGALLREGRLEGCALVGDGAVRHRGRFREAGLEVFGPPAGTATADGLLFLHRRSNRPPLDDAARWEPDYLKASSAERERTR